MFRSGITFIKLLCLLLILVHLLHSAECASERGGRKTPKRYDRYKVLRIGTTKNTLFTIQDLLQKFQVDVWRYPSRFSPSYDVMVGPSVMQEFIASLNSRNIEWNIRIDDVQTLIDQQTKARRGRNRSRRRTRRIIYQQYHPLEKIKQWMHAFTRENSDIVRVIQVGTSYQGRRILALKIGISSNHTKRIVWQDGLIHAREWVTGATLIWLAKELVRNYRIGDPDGVTYLQEFDWYIVPVWNVDGYKYTWNKDRMWRKSRSEGGSFGCYGVDLNRNFFTPNRGEGASSDNPCSEVYHGPFAFSELESVSVRQFMTMKRSQIVAVFTLHSYGQYWLYPYGYTRQLSPDNEILKRLSKEAVLAMQKKHGTVYKHGTVSRLAYPVSGGSIDWVYRELCTKYTFGIELRDSGKHGFLLPPSLIIPTAEEYFEGLKVVVRHILDESTEQQRSGFCRQNIRDLNI